MVLRKSIIPALAIILLIGGCGIYSFKPGGKSDIKAITIERFGNDTAEYGLADRLTDLVIDAFISDGNMKVVPLDQADAVLVGTLTGYSRRPYTYDENDQVLENQVVMNFDISLKKPADDTEIWNEKMSQIGVYNVASETEEDGQNRAIGFLVETVINRTTKSW